MIRVEVRYTRAYAHVRARFDQRFFLQLTKSYRYECLLGTQNSLAQYTRINNRLVKHHAREKRLVGTGKGITSTYLYSRVLAII